MNSSESSQPLRDSQQITFVKLNKFWPLSNNPLHPPPLLLADNIKLVGMPTRLNEKYKPVLHCITGFKRVLLWKLWDTATSSFISCFTAVCPKMSSEIFSTKSRKSVFYISPVNCYVHIFQKVPTTDTLVFISEHTSRAAILTQVSIITCK